MANLKLINDKFKSSVNEGTWMPLLHPSTQEQLGIDSDRPVEIKVLYKSAEPVQKVADSIINDLASRVQKTGKTIKAQQMRDRELAVLVAATVDWRNMDWDDDTQNIPCTQKWIRQIYTEASWAKDQVDAWSSNPRNYGDEEAEAMPLASDAVAFFEEQEKNSQAGANGDSDFSGHSAQTSVMP
jgi:hypothetical protein